MKHDSATIDAIATLLGECLDKKMSLSEFGEVYMDKFAIPSMKACLEEVRASMAALTADLSRIN